MERTLILVKPDAFARGLTGEIIRRFENKGLKITALRHMQVTEDLAKQHYAEHDGKPFFGELVEFITSGPLVAMVLEGESAIKAARQVIGSPKPPHRPPPPPRRPIRAPRSPQRRAILEQLGVPFEVRPADVAELAAGDPKEVALENARRKASAI